MKVIDLLNKKANGEELPSEINCYGVSFYLSDGIYIAKNQVGKYFEDYFDFTSLDYEVEIIEDAPKKDKKIKKIDEEEARNEIFTYSSGSNLYFLSLYVQHNIVGKINELIDKVNGE